MNHTIHHPKSSCSETVIRKALYWLTDLCSWELKESDSEWIITIYTDDPIDVYSAELSRRINDFKLRESLDIRTRELRMKLIQAALARIVDDG